MATTPTLTPEKKPAADLKASIHPHAPRDETLVESLHSSPAIAAPGIVFDAEEDRRPDLPKTKGEWFYDGLQQFGGKGVIITATAALGFLARYGKPWYGKVPNPFRLFNDWLSVKLVSNSFYTIAKDNEVGQRLAGAIASTMVLFHGGNLFSPVMKAIENNRENIANWYNRKWGTPEDVAIAHERLKDEPQQTWGDIVKGRGAAWLTCLSVLLTADFALGKGKLPFVGGRVDKHRFDQYEEWFGRWLAGFTKAGKELANTPLSKELTEIQKQNKVYQFGKITALDFYVTNVAIIIWSFFSRHSAKSRQEKQEAAEKEELEKKVAELTQSIEEAPAERKYTDTIQPRANAAASQPPAAIIDKLAAQRHDASAEGQPALGA